MGEHNFDIFDILSNHGEQSRGFMIVTDWNDQFNDFNKQ